MHHFPACHPEERLSVIARSAKADATKDLNRCFLSPERFPLPQFSLLPLLKMRVE